LTGQLARNRGLSFRRRGYEVGEHKDVFRLATSETALYFWVVEGFGEGGQSGTKSGGDRGSNETRKKGYVKLRAWSGRYQKTVAHILKQETTIIKLSPPYLTVVSVEPKD
jgi:hypothetical protein